jgi:hypothetical protein
MNPKELHVLTQQFHDKINELQEIILKLNTALKETPKKRTTVTFHSNPNRKIEDTGTLQKIEGGINEII